MLLKNPNTGNTIDSNELDYFIRLKLDCSSLDDEWVAQHVDFAEIEKLIFLKLNKKIEGYPSLRKLKLKKKLKKYSVEEINIVDEDLKIAYLLPNGDLMLDLFFKLYLKTKDKRIKKEKKNKTRDLYTILNIKLVVNANRVVYRIVEVSIDAEW